MSAVLVTGATGTVGRSVAENLADAGEQVVCATRGGTDAAGTDVPAGAEARSFDFGDRATWEPALDGVDRVFLLRPPTMADMSQTLIPFIDLALERRVRQLVFLSLQGVQFNRRTPHHAVEQHLRRRDAPYTFLRPNFFMQNLSTVYRDEIRDRGEIYLPAGRARTAFIDARDIGRVARSVFTRPGHERKAYTLSGRQSLSYFDVAAIMTDELGRSVEYANPSSDQYLARLRERGAAPDYIAVQEMIYKVVRSNISALPNRSIGKLTGRPATIFREFVRDHAQLWSADRPA